MIDDILREFAEDMYSMHEIPGEDFARSIDYGRAVRLIRLLKPHVDIKKLSLCYLIFKQLSLEVDELCKKLSWRCDEVIDLPREIEVIEEAMFYGKLK
jgi:hypothetical protein